MGTLSEIFRLAQLILKWLHVIDLLLDNHSLGERTFKAFNIDSLCSSIWFYLLAKTEDLLEWINIPFVIACGLDAGLKIAVGFFVHFGDFWLLFCCPKGWEKDVFGTFTLYSFDSKFKVSISWYCPGPVVISIYGATKRFPLLAGVLTLLYVIKFVCKAVKVLRFDNHVDWVRNNRFSAKLVVHFEVLSVFLKTVMNYANARLVSVGLTILL